MTQSQRMEKNAFFRQVYNIYIPFTKNWLTIIWTNLIPVLLSLHSMIRVKENVSAVRCAFHFCRFNSLILPPQRQSHFCLPFKTLNPANSAGNAVWVCLARHHSPCPTTPPPSRTESTMHQLHQSLNEGATCAGVRFCFFFPSLS